MDPDPLEAPEGGDAPRGEAEHEYRNPSFTFEGQIERLQHWVVGINKRGGQEKRLVQIAVISLLALLTLAYVAGILWGIFA